ncbi:ABC transporter substrate-binding protein [Pseudaminobacter sp. NGMCC 1.201702]|uniref:ABC transporter substrate-binding protein n=1 Tax=Pseudaminobacter sp. NGMCC 1.201702 TaxID=3391825 RepID=UPI0039F0BCC4
MKRRLISVLLAGAFAVCLATVAPHKAKAADEINIAGGIALSWSPLYIADQQKLFEKHGLTATVMPFPSGRTAQEAIVGGAVAWGTVAETPVMFASSNNLPVRIIATMSDYEIFDMVATTDIKGAADLKGKRVGFAQGTNSQVYLARMLDSAGLKMGDITGINLSPTDMMTSLANGQIDAFVWAEPHLSQAVALGGGKFHAIRTPGLYKTFSNIVALQDTIDSSPDMLVRSLCAMKDAAQYMKDNKEASIDYISERIKMDKAIVAKEWDRIPYQINLDKPAIVKELTQQAQWAIDSGLLAAGTKAPDFDQVVVTTIFEQAQNCSGK